MSAFEGWVTTRAYLGRDIEFIEFHEFPEKLRVVADRLSLITDQIS
jgi:hypothetical protein